MPDTGDSRRLIREKHDWLNVDVVCEDTDWSDFEPVQTHINAAAKALASHPRFQNHVRASACIALCDDTAVRKLNLSYRAKDKPTNVLSFPALQGANAAATEPPSLGDVVLAQETVLKEAVEMGVPPAHHLEHLVVHGLLHLLGFDHGNDQDAEEMESLEREILLSRNISDPYAGSEPVASGTIKRGAAKR